MADPVISTAIASDSRFRDMQLNEGNALPPYHLRHMSLIMLIGHWPEGAALPPLPEGLSHAPERTGVLLFYAVHEGAPLAPGRAHVAAVAVRETHAPDGTQAAHAFWGGFDGPRMHLLRDHLSDAFHPAAIEVGIEGRLWTLSAREGGGRSVLRARRRDESNQISSGTNYYIVPRGGRLCGISVTFASQDAMCDIEMLEIDYPDTHPMAVFRDFVVDLCFASPDQTMTYSPPFPLDLATPSRPSVLATRKELDAATGATLDLLGRIGRPLALIDETGRILYANAGAERVIARLAQAGPARLVSPGRAGWGLTLPPEGTRLTLPLAEGGQAAARVLPTTLPSWDGKLLLVLLDDPAAPGPFDPALLLRLHGLTPAEARLAALVGQGAAPAEAAQSLQITRETARSMLKAIYAKLGIGRQAELARLVARFEMV